MVIRNICTIIYQVKSLAYESLSKLKIFEDVVSSNFFISQLPMKPAPPVTNILSFSFSMFGFNLP